MQSKALSWTAVGALAVVGGFWLTTRSLQLLQVRGAWVPYVGHSVGAFLAGAMMVAHTALRPWREPVAAGVLGVGVLALLFLVLPHPVFSWVAARSTTPWLMVLALAVITAAGSLCGAMLARRFTTATPHTAKLVLLSALTITGCAITSIHFAISSGIDTDPNGRLLLLAMTLAVVGGGFMIQLMVPVYRPWASGSGAVILALITFAESSLTSATLQAFGSSLLLGCVGALGARLARRWVRRTDAAPHESLPSAQTR